MSRMFTGLVGSQRPRLATLLLAGVLAVPSLLGAQASAGPTAAGNTQPQLARIAAQKPDSLVSVIVQMTDKGAHVEGAVKSLGGSVTKDLHIINAFAASIPGKAVEKLAATPGVRWISLDAPVAQSTVDSVFTTWSNKLGNSVSTNFSNGSNIVDSAQGANGTYGSGSNVRGAFAGFEPEVAPGTSISKVEVALQAYVANNLGYNEDPRLTFATSTSSGYVSSASYTLRHEVLNNYVGAANSGTLYIDVTSLRTWRWSDFDNNLELQIDQTRINSGHNVYYDAVGLRVTASAGTDTSSSAAPLSLSRNSYDASQMSNAYNAAVRATDVWSNSGSGQAGLQGQGMTVAVIDSGIVKNKDLDKRLIGSVNFNTSYHASTDRYGHGTFVGDIIAGDGTYSSGTYVGIAPRTNLVNVRVSDDQGMATESEVINGLQWVNDNRTPYNIRVVNMSLNSSSAQSYNTSPLDAAVEILWFNGVTVVTSAGNNGTANLFPPANDPFVITVGATNDNGTASLSDDSVAPFSAYGVTESGAVKPDLVAPGTNIIAYLPNNDRTTIAQVHPANRVTNYYFKMSGTSMAAPMVSGAVALLLQDEPNLTPDQVKYRLKSTAVSSTQRFPGYNRTTAGAGYLDIYAAVNSTSTQSSNTGTAASQLLWTGTNSVSWGSVNWGSVNWGSVNWGSVNWGSVNWGSVNWGSDYWTP